MKVILKEYIDRQKMLLYNMRYLPDPDEVVGSNYDEYRKLLEDPHVYAAVQQRKSQVSQMGWELVNYTDEDKEYEEILTIMRRFDLPRIISEILNALFLGYSVLEIMWKRFGEKIYPVDLIEKPQEWFAFDAKNKIVLKKGLTVKTLPRMKFIVAQNEPTFKNPYGEKLLKKIYWTTKSKAIAVAMWQKLAERYGMPSLVGRYPSTATETEIEQLLEDLEKMIEDNITVMSADNEIEFQESMKYNAGMVFEKLMEFYNAEISKAILTVTLTTEIARRGAYSAAQVHQEMLEYIGLHDKKLVEKVFNQMFAYAWLVNYGELKEAPRIKLEKKERIVEATIERDKILKEMGVEFTEEYYKKKYNLEREDFRLMDNE